MSSMRFPSHPASVASMLFKYATSCRAVLSSMTGTPWQERRRSARRTGFLSEAYPRRRQRDSRRGWDRPGPGGGQKRAGLFGRTHADRRSPGRRDPLETSLERRRIRELKLESRQVTSSRQPPIAEHDPTQHPLAAQLRAVAEAEGMRRPDLKVPASAHDDSAIANFDQGGNGGQVIAGIGPRESQHSTKDRKSCTRPCQDYCPQRDDFRAHKRHSATWRLSSAIGAVGFPAWVWKNRGQYRGLRRPSKPFRAPTGGRYPRRALETGP